MTLEQAIEHCCQKSQRADIECECAKEHAELTNWLLELYFWREFVSMRVDIHTRDDKFYCDMLDFAKHKQDSEMIKVCTDALNRTHIELGEINTILLLVRQKLKEMGGNK